MEKTLELYITNHNSLQPIFYELFLKVPVQIKTNAEILAYNSLHFTALFIINSQ